jgi:quercetin dioxygenase-like cupin family protein
MDHPTVIQPARHAQWRPDKMGKATIFESPRLLVGLNAFEPGHVHELHAHQEMDKLYYVLEGDGIRNTGTGRLLVLAVLAPAP